jgi:hypothetical protein
MNQCPIKLPNFNKKYLFIIKRLTKNCDRGHFKSQHAWRILILLIIMTWIQNPKTRTPQTSIRWISMFGELCCTGMSSWVPASGHWATESSSAAHLGRFALGGNPSCSLVSSQATVCFHQGWGRALWTPSCGLLAQKQRLFSEPP